MASRDSHIYHLICHHVNADNEITVKHRPCVNNNNWNLFYWILLTFIHLPIQSLWSFWIRLKLKMIRLYSTHRKNCQQISLVWGWCVKPGFLYYLIGIAYYLHYCNYNPSFVLMPRLTSENFRPKRSLKFKIGILATHLSSFSTWAADWIENSTCDPGN